MTEIDERDYDEFLEGVFFFLRLDAAQIIGHMQIHREDAFTFIRHFSGHGNAFCTRAGMERMRQLIKRRVRALPNGSDCDTEDLLHEFSELIGPSLKEGQDHGKGLEETFEDVFAVALSKVTNQHKGFTFHLPCVLAGAQSPAEFNIGPVTFTTVSVFEVRLASLNSDLREFDERIRDLEFLHYIRQFGWIASVKVPPCSLSVSKFRAELAARTAINIVRVWFGLGHGERMRLVHTEPATSGFSKFLMESDGKISLNWSRKSEGAPVVADWFTQVDVHHHKLASWLLNDIVNDKRSELAERLIDALSWFGDAAFEPSPGAKIAKLVMLLERLTATARRFSKKRFCRRIAILALDDDADFGNKYWAAYEFYNARSGITHGANSQTSVEHWAALKDANALITNSIFRAFEVYQLIHFGEGGSPRSLKAFFDQQENHWLFLTKSLDAELVAKDKLIQF